MISVPGWCDLCGRFTPLLWVWRGEGGPLWLCGECYRAMAGVGEPYGGFVPPSEAVAA